MLTTFAGLAGLAVFLLGTLGSATAQPSAAAAGTSSTATSRPTDAIAARKALMKEAGLVMIPVDAFAAAEAGDTQPDTDLQRAAQSIERLLLAFPQLFPSTTNLYDEATDPPPTAALPRVWENFAQFDAANEAAIRAAQALAAATGAAEQRAAAAALRASCDGCHAAYVQAYAPPTVTDADRQVDFDFDFN
jgi:cytochrome c556